MIAHVTQDVERQFIRLRGRKRLLWQLWRDRYESGAQSRYLRQDCLVGSQLDIAVGAPTPPIERKHDRASPEQIGEGDRVSPYVRHPKTGRRSLAPGGRLEREAGPKLLDLGLVEGGPPRRSHAQEFRL